MKKVVVSIVAVITLSLVIGVMVEAHFTITVGGEAIKGPMKFIYSAWASLIVAVIAIFIAMLLTLFISGMGILLVGALASTIGLLIAMLFPVLAPILVPLVMVLGFICFNRFKKSRSFAPASSTHGQSPRSYSK
ncbi:hypothetical protein [Vibrio mexicanus]|uniref:hypothetical protein n=1 Tax=Vibrio mexicanus TaxID=1004326 RepID=UPI00063C18F5|nr:hypothetical protein [Vibrio mexicanus]